MLLALLPWALFLAFIAGMLALDLGVFHRHAHEVRRREALAWSAAWIGLAIVFNAGVYLFRGPDAGLEWTTGYLVEKTLSIDNVFVILLIFSAFGCRPSPNKAFIWASETCEPSATDQSSCTAGSFRSRPCGCPSAASPRPIQRPGVSPFDE